MAIIGIIPARLNSTRLPRKMLIDIAGKPLLVHTWQRVQKARMLDRVIVATDSVEIHDVMRSVGAEVFMTSSKPCTGTDRVAEAAHKLKARKDDIIINIQGDEPLMPARAINKTAALLVDDPSAVMSTVARPFPAVADLDEPGQVKVVLDKVHFALYFSRACIPFPRTPYTRYYNHLGIYGYRNAFLQTLAALRQTPLEKAESLEQLRALEHGYKIKVGIGKYDRIEVNEPHELEAVRQKLSK